MPSNLKFKAIWIATMFSLLPLAATAGEPTISSTAMPAGGSVIASTSGTLVDGSASPDLSSVASGSTIELSNKNYNNPVAVIRWQNGFDIGSNSTLNFSTAANQQGYVLNIDGSSNPSEINGTLAGSSNVTVFVANGNGIYVGPSANIQMPGGVGLLAESMNNSTAVNDFIGNNGSSSEILDFGSLYPGTIDVEKGATISAVNSGILLAGSSIVNSGSISGSTINILAGYAPQKSTATIAGIPSTPVYRLGYLDNVISDSPNNYYYYSGIAPFQYSSTFTNNGTISAQTTNSQNIITSFSTAGMANYGVLQASDSKAPSYGDNTGVEVFNLSGNASNYNLITSQGSRSASSVLNSNVVASSGLYNYDPSVVIAAPSGNLVFGKYGVASGAVVDLIGESINGYSASDNVDANDLFLLFSNNLNSTAGNPTPANFLANAFGVTPYTSGNPMYVSITSSGEGITHGSVVNLAINGSGLITSGDTRTEIATVLNNLNYNGYLGTDRNGNYTAPPSSPTQTTTNTSTTNYGGSMLIQASGTLSVEAPSNTYLDNSNPENNYFSSGNNYGNGGAFTFAGGIVLIGNDGINVNVPILNGWSQNSTAFQGVFLEGSQIDFNNNAYIVTGQGQFVNFSTQPGSVPPIYQFVYGNTVEPSTDYNSAFGSGAFLNSYTSILSGVLNGKSLGSLVNTTPIGG